MTDILDQNVRYLKISPPFEIQSGELTVISNDSFEKLVEAGMSEPGMERSLIRSKSGKFEFLVLGRTIGQVQIHGTRRPETHYGLEIIAPDFMGFMIDRFIRKLRFQIFENFSNFRF